MKERMINFVDKVKKLNFKDKRILILTIISVLALVTLASTSFALFLKSYETDKKDLFATGDLLISFDDETSNAININPTKPISDAYGSTLKPYTFTITNNGTYKSSFSVKLVDSTDLTSDSINKLKPVLKYQINDNAPQYLKDTDNQILVSGHISAGQSITYNLRMWIAYEATEEIEKLTYSGSLSLSGKAVNPKKFISSSDKNVILNNTTIGNSIQNLKLYGNSEQNGTPTPETPIEVESVGDKTKNLFDKDNINLTLHKVNLRTSTITPDSTLILQPNTYKLTLFTSNENDLKYKLGYSILVNQNGENKEIYLESNSVSTNGVFTVDTVTTINGIYVFLSSSDNDTAQITIDRVQLEIGDTATEYEPYGKYKIPVKVSGKNLFNPKHNFTSYSGDGLTIKYLEEEDAYLINGTAAATVRYATRSINIPNIKGSYYSLSTNYVSGKVTRTEDTDYVVAYFGGGDSLSESANWQTAGLHEYDYKKENVQCNHNYINKFWFYISKGVTFENYKVRIQLEQNSTATAYEPYIEPVTHNVYLDEPLRKIGDYADYVDFENQKLVRKIRIAELKSTWSWGDYGSSAVHTNNFKYKGIEKFYFISNYGNPGNSKFSFSNNNFNRISISYDWLGVEDVEGVKTKLAEMEANGKPFTIYYPTNEIPEETIDLPKITSLNGTTILSVDTSVNATFEGAY